MKDFSSTLFKFQYSLKLEKLKSNILEFLSDSLEIKEKIDNRTELIKKIIQNLSILEQKEFEKFDNIINEMVDSKTETAKPNINESTHIHEKSPKRKFNYKIKKRAHMEIENEEDKKNENKKVFRKHKKEYKYEKLMEKCQRYYFTDENDKEWEFREKNGSSESYYFKCTIEKCKGFGMILRFDETKKFKLTKSHSILYVLHTYCVQNSKNNIFENTEFTQKDWDQHEFRISYINWFFNKNINASESECLIFIKTKLKLIYKN